MKCPACSHLLTQVNAGDVDVDVCQNGCGGVWFDHKEIERFDEQAEVAGEKLVSIARAPHVQRHAAPLSCPRCSTEPLVRQYFDSMNKVQIDLCWSCGGVWLDTGELAAVRTQFKDAAERQKQGDKFVRDVLDQHKAVLAAKTKEEVGTFNARHRNKFSAVVSSLRSLFDPLDDGVFN